MQHTINNLSSVPCRSVRFAHAGSPKSPNLIKPKFIKRKKSRGECEMPPYNANWSRSLHAALSTATYSTRDNLELSLQNKLPQKVVTYTNQCASSSSWSSGSSPTVVPLPDYPHKHLLNAPKNKTRKAKTPQICYVPHKHRLLDSICHRNVLGFRSKKGNAFLRS